MALPRSLVLLLGLLALGAAGGAGWLLLGGETPPATVGSGGGATGRSGAGEGSDRGEPGVPGGERGPGDAPGEAPEDDPEDDPDDMADLERSPHGPEGGATTEEILAAIAQGNWLEVERLLSAGGGNDDPAVTAALLEGLKDGRWRNAVAGMAHLLKDPAAFQRFLEIATGDENPLVRSAALRAAASMGGPGVLEAAGELLRSEKAGSPLGNAAATALGILGTPEAARQLVQALRDRANGPYEAAVVEALARVRSPEALAALGTLVQDSAEDVELRKAIIRALGQSKEPSVVNDLLLVSRDQGDAGLRSAAYRALALIGSPEAVQELLQVLHGGDNQQRYEAARALQNTTAKAAGPMLEQALAGHIDPALKSYVVTALGRTGSASSVEVLGKIATDASGDAGLRGAAVRSMGEIGHGSAAPVLVGILEDTAPSDAALRNQCMLALQKTATVEVLPRLERIFEGVREETTDWFYLRSLIARLQREAGR